MDAATYLDHLRHDGSLLSKAAGAAGLGAPVPSCPGWTVSDLVSHTAAVYAHKLAVLRTGSRPEEWTREAPDGDVLAWYDDELTQLVDELGRGRYDESCWSWFPPDRTRGFWVRRMAQEALIHRVDAELAAGTPVSAIDGDLADDGTEEVLERFLALWLTGEDVGGTGQVVVVSSASGRHWRLELQADRVLYAAGDDPAAALRVTGAPTDLVLWLWGRGGPERLAVEGDAALLGTFRSLLVEATQ